MEGEGGGFGVELVDGSDGGWEGGHCGCGEVGSW